MPTIASLIDCAEYHLDNYTNPTKGYAFATYDRRWGNTSAELTPLDCLAANLLSLRLGQAQIIPLFQIGDAAGLALANAMRQVLATTDADDLDYFMMMSSIEDERFQLLRIANSLASPVRGWTAVTVCKVLHRLRPGLVPIYDSVVREFYQVRRGWPRDFFAALHQDLVRSRGTVTNWVADRYTPDGRPLPLLRAADIVIWHHQHEGGCASVAEPSRH